MKILNLCLNAPFAEGYHYQDNLLSEFQARLKHDVTVVSTTKTRNAEGKVILTEPGEKIMENGVKLIRLPLQNKVMQLLGFYPQLLSVLKKEEPDFIFIHGLASLIPMQAIYYSKKYNNITIVADNHQDFLNVDLRKIYVRFQIYIFRLLWKVWISSVGKIYGTTPWRADFAHNIYGIPQEKIDVLPTGGTIMFNSEEADKIRVAVRQELGISKDQFVFVHGGKLAKNKLTIETMKAFAKLSPLSGILLIFGSVASDISEEFTKLLNNTPHIIYLGMLNGKIIYKYFYAADFGIFPGLHSTLWEEALCCGLPCLFRAYGENMHINKNQNSLILKYADENSIYDGLQKVINDHSYWSSLRERTRAIAHDFSYSRIAEKSLETKMRNE